MWVFVYMCFLEIKEQIQEEITAVIDLGIFTVQCKDRRGVPKKSQEGYLGKVISDLDLQGYKKTRRRRVGCWRRDNSSGKFYVNVENRSMHIPKKKKNAKREKYG